MFDSERVVEFSIDHFVYKPMIPVGSNNDILRFETRDRMYNDFSFPSPG